MVNVGMYLAIKAIDNVVFFWATASLNMQPCSICKSIIYLVTKTATWVIGIFNNYK